MCSCERWNKHQKHSTKKLIGFFSQSVFLSFSQSACPCNSLSVCLSGFHEWLSGLAERPSLNNLLVCLRNKAETNNVIMSNSPVSMWTIWIKGSIAIIIHLFLELCVGFKSSECHDRRGEVASCCHEKWEENAGIIRNNHDMFCVFQNVVA